MSNITRGGGVCYVHLCFVQRALFDQVELGRDDVELGRGASTVDRRIGPPRARTRGRRASRGAPGRHTRRRRRRRARRRRRRSRRPEYPPSSPAERAERDGEEPTSSHALKRLRADATRMSAERSSRRVAVVLAEATRRPVRLRRIAPARAVERRDVLQRNEDVPVQLDVRTSSIEQ